MFSRFLVDVDWMYWRCLEKIKLQINVVYGSCNLFMMF